MGSLGPLPLIRSLKILFFTRTELIIKYTIIARSQSLDAEKSATFFKYFSCNEANEASSISSILSASPNKTSSMFTIGLQDRNHRSILARLII